MCKYHKGEVRVRCMICGHKMRSKKEIFLNDMKPISYWKCSKCKAKFRVKISILRIK